MGTYACRARVEQERWWNNPTRSSGRKMQIVNGFLDVDMAKPRKKLRSRDGVWPLLRMGLLDVGQKHKTLLLESVEVKDSATCSSTYFLFCGIRKRLGINSNRCNRRQARDFGHHRPGCTVHLLKENSTSVAIEMKKGPVLPGSNVAGMIVNSSSSQLLSNINPRGVDTSWVGTIGDPSYGRP